MLSVVVHSLTSTINTSTFFLSIRCVHLCIFNLRLHFWFGTPIVRSSASSFPVRSFPPIKILLFIYPPIKIHLKSEWSKSSHLLFYMEQKDIDLLEAYTPDDHMKINISTREIREFRKVHIYIHQRL